MTDITFKFKCFVWLEAQHFKTLRTKQYGPLRQRRLERGGTKVS